jgi:Flp pilus assembly protein TadD
MTDSVICASCGARIKADRERCLRCGEVLVARDTRPLHEMLGLTQPQLRLMTIVLAVLFFGGLGALWALRPQPLADEIAQPAIDVARQATPRSVPDAAASDTTTAVEIPPAEAVSTDAARIGYAAFRNGDFESARAAYERALQMNPDDAVALNGYGQSLVRVGRAAEAVPQFERAVSIDSAKWAYRFNLAHAVGLLGQWDRAVAEYRQALSLFPSDYATQFNLAMALHKKGDDQAAIPEFRKAIDLAPAEPSFHVALAICLERVGNVPEAIREYRTLLEVDPLNVDAAKIKARIDALQSAAAQPPPGSGASTTPRTP